MSKVYNKIVQSNTEPSKNDIWLKDGQMKTFGKEGWKPVGGGVSEGNNEPVGDKEIYVLDATRTDYETLFNEVSEAWDSNKQIILNYLPEGNVPIFDILLTRSYKEEDSIVFGAGPVIIPHFYGSGCFMTPMLIIIIFKDDIKINDTSISEFTEESLGYIKYTLDNKIYLSSNGDGTKFLSDDGTYKEITSGSLIPQLNSIFYVETNNVVFDSADVDILSENRKVILTLQYGSGSASTYEYITCDVIYRSASTNTYNPTIIGHYFYNNKTYIVTFETFKFDSNISVSPICIDDLNTKVANLESRIAALEGATA